MYDEQGNEPFTGKVIMKNALRITMIFTVKNEFSMEKQMGNMRMVACKVNLKTVSLWYDDGVVRK